MKTSIKLILALILLVVVSVTGSSAKAAPGDTTRISVASDGTQANDESGYPSISADGRYVAFESGATNLLAGDTNGIHDVFVRDQQTGTVALVSVASDGTQGNGVSRYPSISADGRYVAFFSSATNLVAGDTNGYPDIFVHDLQTGDTTRVSVASDGTQGNDIPRFPSISGDGRYVAFESDATNLVSGDTNGWIDVFVHDRLTGITTRVSVASDGTQGNSGSQSPSISADGRFVAFGSGASNLVAGDTAEHGDVFVHDQETGLTTRVSVASDGTQGNGGSGVPSISADGRYVAFSSYATNLVAGDTNGYYDIFVHDRQTGVTTLASVASNGMQGNSDSLYLSISGDGQRVAFLSVATNLVAGDTNDWQDIFIHDQGTGVTTRVSVASDGAQENWPAMEYFSISADGRYVAFASWATNLVIGDTNDWLDIFMHELEDSVAPTVLNIVRANGTPTSAANVDFVVTFSKAVDGVDKNDFSLSTTGGISGAAATDVVDSGDHISYTVSVNTGMGNGTIRLDVVDDDSIKDVDNNPLGGVGAGNGNFTAGEVYDIVFKTWYGGVSISSNRNVVAVGRPHVGAEVATYTGFTGGSLDAYIPMLFKDAFGGSYDSALYVENLDTSNTANITIHFYDSSGNETYSMPDTIAPLASKGYWLPSIAGLGSSWVGGVKVESDRDIVAVGRPHVGPQVMTYNGFSAGSTTAYVPMLFKDAFGGSYDAALYIQNVDPSNTADITIHFYDASGNETYSMVDTLSPLASKGYWLPSISALGASWVGGVKVESNRNIVAVGRPHIGSQVLTYNGFSSGSLNTYVPMLFKDAFGGSYDSALYVQNVDPSTNAHITIRFYDSNGVQAHSMTDTVSPLASKGYWLPAITPLGTSWVGGVKVESDRDIVAVGRPHVGAQVMAYNGFASGSTNAYVPMLFKDAFGGSYDSALYIQNLDASNDADVTIKFYDVDGNLSCTLNDTISALASKGWWLPSLKCSP